MTNRNELIQNSKALDGYIGRTEARAVRLQQEIAFLQQNTQRLRADWQDHQFYEFETVVRNLSSDMREQAEELKKTLAALRAHAERLGWYENL